MKITIAGAGAMGSRFGLMLHQAGHEVLLVDGWKDHVDAIQKRGSRQTIMGRSRCEVASCGFKVKSQKI